MWHLWRYVFFLFFSFDLFLFVFVFLLSLKPRSFVQSFFDMHEIRKPQAGSEQLSGSWFLLFCFYFCFLGEINIRPTLSYAYEKLIRKWTKSVFFGFFQSYGYENGPDLYGQICLSFS